MIGESNSIKTIIAPQVVFVKQIVNRNKKKWRTQGFDPGTLASLGLL